MTTDHIKVDFIIKDILSLKLLTLLMDRGLN